MSSSIPYYDVDEDGNRYEAGECVIGVTGTSIMTMNVDKNGEVGSCVLKTSHSGAIALTQDDMFAIYHCINKAELLGITLDHL